MSSTRTGRIASFAIAFAPMILICTLDAAFAAAGSKTGITQLDTAQTTLVTFVQGLAIFACIFLLGILVWDFVQHRNISRSIFEFLGVIILGVIGLNAGAIANTFQSAGALVH